MKKFRTILISLIIALSASSCVGPDEPPVPVTIPYIDGKSSTSSEDPSDYLYKRTTKVIFNKNHFYNNQDPNSMNCAGDAKDFFDPLKDRIAPTKPNWVRNISVDVTNSNALFGPSRALSCSLSGSYSNFSSNCASFDDLQPNTGFASRSVLIGGYGCSTSDSSCGENESISDVWHLAMQSDSSTAGWTQQPTGLPLLSGTAAGLSFSSGDYSELEDAFYLFGGSTPSGSTITGTRSLNRKLVKISFNSDGSLNTSSSITIPYTQNTPINYLTYGHWSFSNLGGGILIPQNYSPVVKSGFGASFTYGVRRDPTMATFCRTGDNGGNDATDDANDDDYCSGTGVVAGSGANVKTEHQDYFLLLGGAMPTLGAFNDTIYVFKPKNISNSLTPTATLSGGDWDVVYDSNASFNSIMKTTKLSASGSTTQPVSITSTTWSGRAFHKTTFDPLMNRFYIFGGLSGNTNTQSYSLLNEMWIYDPPALGRRPNAACWSAIAPDSSALPLASTLYGTQPSSGILANYWNNRMVFPAGGCMQKITFSGSVPDARFEHSMAFDRNEKMMLLYGGCTQLPTNDLQVAGGTSAGDPTLNCNNGSALLKDTWVYLPPTNTEYVPNDFTASTGPYSTTDTTRIPNIFGTDWWNLHRSINASTPTVNELLGFWVKLTPTTSPHARVSGNLIYDRAHHKYILFGGYGCKDSNCNTIGTLNDMWEFIPPKASDCNYKSATCSNNGTWTQLKSSSNADVTLPHVRKGAVMAYGQPMFSFGDGYYTVNDTSCTGQGPIASSDPSASKNYVGSIYIHIDRSKFKSNENLLINLRFLPFDERTRLAGISPNGTPYTESDDTDIASTNDQALIRVRALNSPITDESALQSSIQPRYHDFLSGTPIISDNLVYASGASGQVTEKQIFIPLQIDPSIDLIKIERVSGSVKFFELTVTKL